MNHTGNVGLKGSSILKLSPEQTGVTLVVARRNGKLPWPLLDLEIISPLLIIFELHLYGFSDPSQDINCLRELDVLPN